MNQQYGLRPVGSTCGEGRLQTAAQPTGAPCV